MPFDSERARCETRACENLIHFYNAGSLLMTSVVSEALQEILKA
jgi:hypothetical protein